MCTLHTSGIVTCAPPDQNRSNLSSLTPFQVYFINLHFKLGFTKLQLSCLRPVLPYNGPLFCLLFPSPMVCTPMFVPSSCAKNLEICHCFPHDTESYRLSRLILLPLLLLAVAILHLRDSVVSDFPPISLNISVSPTFRSPLPHIFHLRHTLSSLQPSISSYLPLLPASSTPSLISSFDMTSIEIWLMINAPIMIFWPIVYQNSSILKKKKH